MHAEVHPDATFYVTGHRAGAAPDAPAAPPLCPALLAAYRDLTKLRYDFPLVLRSDLQDERVFEPLCALTDRLIEGGAERQQALRQERALRANPAARAGIDGELVECDVEMPARLLAHVWRATQEQKAAAFRRTVERLIVTLDDILRADHERSAEGRSAASLKASFGDLHDQAFDFESMSRLLGSVSVQIALSDSRRGRIESTLAALRAQRFYATGAAEALEFRFESCAAALQAFRERVPDMMRLAKALTLAELEVQGEFSSERHDALFEQLAASGLDLRDLALFPDYLVCVRDEKVRGAEQDALLEILAGGLPMKILLQTDDLLGEPRARAGHAPAGAHARQLAHMALGLNSVHVLQASAAQLAVQREPLLRAMRCPGAALLSVFSGAGGHAGDLPPYLVAAAATESRAFPSFSYDPAAGADWASRFSLAGNPQPERDWPLHELAYEDAEHQRVQAQVAFTLMDFAACDVRYAGHFAAVPRAGRGAALVPAADCVQREAKGVPDQLPSLLMVDDANFVHPAIVDDRLLREARRCHEAWRSLQELGGIRNSHAERLLARERQKWEEAQATETPAPKPESAAPAAPAPATAVEPEAPPARASDEPYIETPRCSSCDECIQINSKMFAYDANKQARIVDMRAGTYRQLVEAAESCQVAIIHPGKPKNPDEPGLEELLKRAAAFP
ncbi:MAG: ferredoxin [Betaproteobacteria bacterium]|nr:ferredoxin [Betaproteobacteria bacterium]